MVIELECYDRSTPVPVLYLDIDGTVREGPDDALGRFVNGPGDVRVFPHAVDQMRAWKQLGGRIIGVSNQGGIALGHVTITDAHAAMVETARQCDELFDHIAVCRHHPTAPDPELARCWCRKPRPGMAIQAATQLRTELAAQGIYERYPPHLALVVGDMGTDQQMAAALNADFGWAYDWRQGIWTQPSPPPSHPAADQEVTPCVSPSS